MYGRFVKNVYLPLLAKLRQDTSFEIAKELEQSQWRDAERLQAEQWEKLVRSLKQAARHVMYYSRLFEAHGIDAEQIDTPEDFQKVPLLDKQALREAGRQMLSLGYQGKRYRTATSGSTGLSLQTMTTPESESWVSAGQLRARAWFGIRPGDRGVYVWGRPLSSPWAQRMARIKARMKNILLISAFELSDSTLRRHWRRIDRFAPQYVYGYASSIFQLSDFMKRKGIRPSRPCKAVITTAETLFESQRETIAAAWRCPVRQEYGCAETGAFAYECPEKKYHVFAENVFVEIIKDGRPAAPGETGEIVLTTLNNEGMPLIRYRLGDAGSRDDAPCACGRGLPVLKLTAGKITDLVKGTNGELVSSEIFDYINLDLIKKGIRGIRQFMVTQKSEKDFTVQIVKDEPFQEEAVRRFETRMIEFLGDGIRVDFDFVPEIPRSAAGKVRYFVSQMGGTDR